MVAYIPGPNDVLCLDLIDITGLIQENILLDCDLYLEYLANSTSSSLWKESDVTIPIVEHPLYMPIIPFLPSCVMSIYNCCIMSLLQEF